MSDYRYTDPATTRLPPVGAVYQPRMSGWVEDPNEPTGWRWERDVSPAGSATQILPTVGRIEYGDAVDYPRIPTDRSASVHGVTVGDAVDYTGPSERPVFEHDDGSVYERPDPDEFDSFDEVDSTTIVDDGAPD